MSRDARPLSGLDLNLLVTLRVLLREANVSRAATSLGQSQPTVSRALAALRQAFDDPLLVRSGRAMVLTPCATALVQPLERLLADMDHLARAARFDAATSSHTFRVAMPELLGPTLLPAIVSSFTMHAPHARLVVVDTHKNTLSDLLEDGVDLLLSPVSLDHAELYRRVIPHARFGWSVLHSHDHPLASMSLTLDDWLGARHVQITPSGRPDRPGPIDLALTELGMTRHVTLHINHISALHAVLTQHRLVTSLPTPVARELATRHALLVRTHPLDAHLPTLDLKLTWRHTRHTHAAHLWFRDLVTDAASSLDFSNYSSDE